MALQYRSSSSAATPAPVDWEVFEEELSRVDPCFSRPNFDSLKHVLTVLSSNNAEQEVEEVGHSARLHCPAAAHRRAPTRHCRHPLACPLPCSSSPQPNGTALTHTRVICVCYCLFVSCSLMHVQLRDQRASIEALVDAVVEGYHSGFNTSIHNYSRILRLFTQSKMQVRCRGGWVGAMRLRQLRLQPQLDTHRLLFCVPALSHPNQTRRSTPPPPAAAAAAAGCCCCCCCSWSRCGAPWSWPGGA